MKTSFFVWGWTKKNHLMRVICSPELVASDRGMETSLANAERAGGACSDKVDPEAIANRVRAETAGKLATGLFAMLGGGAGGPELAAVLGAAPAAGAAIQCRPPPRGRKLSSRCGSNSRYAQPATNA